MHPRTIHPLEWLAVPRPKPRWHVDGLLPEGAWIMVVAPAKEGKSRLVQQMGHAIANGEEFVARPTTQGRVLYLDLDEPEGDILDRFDDFAAAGLNMAGPLHYAHPEDLMKPLNLLYPQAQEWAKALVDTFNPDIVVMDSLREIHTGDENDSGDAVRISHCLQRVVGNRTLVLIHHARKLSADHEGIPDPRSFGRGSNYWSGRVSATWMLYESTWYVAPRSGERLKFPLRMDEGVWQFPSAQAFYDQRQRIIELCAESGPAATHTTIAKTAKQRWGVSRATFYRHLKAAAKAGTPCIHGDVA